MVDKAKPPELHGTKVLCGINGPAKVEELALTRWAWRRLWGMSRRHRMRRDMPTTDMRTRLFAARTLPRQSGRERPERRAGTGNTSAGLTGASDVGGIVMS